MLYLSTSWLCPSSQRLVLYSIAPLIINKHFPGWLRRHHLPLDMTRETLKQAPILPSDPIKSQQDP